MEQSLCFSKHCVFTRACYFKFDVFIDNLKYFANTLLSLFYNFYNWSSLLDGLHCHFLCLHGSL